MKKKNKFRPWLTPTTVAVPTESLKEIARTWDAKTWADYLKWFEHSRRERLVTPGVYTDIGENLTQSIFEDFKHSVTPAKMNLVERLLRQLPEHQQKIIRLYFFEGLPEPKIAAFLKRSRSNVGYHKNQALSRLKRGNSGNIWAICLYMRGKRFSKSEKAKYYWDQPTQFPFREGRTYLPEDQVKELADLNNTSLRAAISSESPRSQTIIYLHHFCGHSVRQIARHLAIGSNVVEMISEAAALRIKRKYIEFDTGLRPGERDAC